MKRLLDTDVIVAVIRDRPPTVRQRLLSMSPEDLAVSTISIAELSFGAA